MSGENRQVDIYTDGACSGNPGPGGWAAILLYGKEQRELSGYKEYTTNQLMELQAAIEGLKALKFPCRVRLFSDSAYLINAFVKGWINKWQMNGWQTVKKEPVENQEQFETLIELSRVHQIEWIKVEGHANNFYNNQCDKLAREAITAQGGVDRRPKHDG